MTNIFKISKEIVKQFFIAFLPLTLMFTGIVGVIYFVETNLTGSALFNILMNGVAKSAVEIFLKRFLDPVLPMQKELIVKLSFLYIVFIIIAVIGSIIYLRLYLIRRKSKEWLRKLSQAVEQSPGMVMITDKYGHVEYINPSFIKVTGFKLNQLLGLTLDMYDRDGKPLRLEKEVFIDIVTEGRWKGEFKSMKKNGEFYIVSSTISPIKNDDGEITHYVIVSENITDTIAVEEKMTRLAMAIESTADGIIITDSDGKIEYVNPAMMAITGCIADEIIGKDLSIIQSGLMSKEFFMQLSEKHHIPGVEQIIMAEEFYADIWKSMKKGKTWKGQLLGRRKAAAGVIHELPPPELSELPDPSMYWAQATITPIFNKNDTIIGYVVTQRDVTKEVMRKEKINMQKEELEDRLKEISQLRSLDETHLMELNMANSQLKLAMEEAYNAYRSKDEFLANVSHELRTPIIGISGMIDMLLETQLEQEQREFVELTRLSADILLTLINDILDFSKFEAGGITLESMPFNVRTLVGDTIRILYYRAKEKGLNLTQLIMPNVPQTLNGDSIRLRQILINLIGNAIKFTNQGAVKFYLEVEDIDPPMVTLHFSVIDTGIGILEENQEKIFKAFTQADGSTSRKYGGTGLGLAISAQLVEKMNGRIWVQSTIGHGSIFHFTVKFELSKDVELIESDHPPMQKGAAQQISNIGQTRQTQGPIPVSKESATTGINVLVAEDNIVNQRFIKTLLQKKQYIVTIVNNGKEALKILEIKHFDIVLMDVNMPEMDGLEAAFIIREQEKGGRRHIPIIAITANTSQSDREKCFRAGMDTFLPRPIKAQILFETIEGLLNNSNGGVEIQSVEADLIGNQTGQTLTPTAVHDLDIFDLNAILESIDGDTDLLKEMIEIFLVKSTEQLDEIFQAIDCGDHALLESKAHSLKGSIGHFYARCAYDVVLKLEKLGRDNCAISNALGLYSDLQKEMSLLKTALKKVID
jgi:PAS domain S-box-containing protein